MVTFKEDMQALFAELVKLVEFERFKMGMGKYAFAKYLGMHYHTYNSFVKQDRITSPQTGGILLQFLVDRGIDIVANDILRAPLEKHTHLKF